VGDGSCLIHAFLLQLSATYRGLSNVKKGQVGRAYRQYLFQQLSGPQSQRATWAGVRPYDDILADLRSLRVNLQDEILSMLCRFFNVGVIYITCSRYGALINVESSAGRDFVMIANIGDGTHYEACVVQRDQFTVPRSVAEAVQRVQGRLYDERAARQAADPNSTEAKRLRAFARLRPDYVSPAAAVPATASASAISDELTLEEQRALFDLDYIDSGLTPAEIQSLWNLEHPFVTKEPAMAKAKAPHSLDFADFPDFTDFPDVSPKAPKSFDFYDFPEFPDFPDFTESPKAGLPSKSPARDKLLCESPKKIKGISVEEARSMLRNSSYQPKEMDKEELCSALCGLHRIDEWNNRGTLRQCNRRFSGKKRSLKKSHKKRSGAHKKRKHSIKLKRK